MDEKIESQYIAVDLPSKGKVYPEGTVVSLRTMRVKDERIIADMTADNFEAKLQQLLRQVSNGIDVSELTLGDRLYCLLWLRINSYSKDYTVDMKCPICGEDVTYTFDLSALKIIELPDDFKEPVSTELPVSKKIVNVKLFRSGDEERILNYSKTMKINEYVVRYAASLTGDEFKSLADKVSFCMDLDVKDFAAIRDVNDVLGNHGPEFKQDYRCPECGGDVRDLPLPFQLSFFIPKGVTVGNITNKV